MWKYEEPNNNPIEIYDYARPEYKIPFFCHFRTKGMWWFRILGYGIHWKDIKYHPELFSERKNLKKLRIGRYRFGWLSRKEFK
jgi:hypothetical protein